MEIPKKEKKAKSKKRKLHDPLALTGDHDRGRLAPIASSILMTVLYAARMARFDLLRATNRLARYVTRWSESCDRRFHQLMSHVDHSLNKRQIGWVGDMPTELAPHMFCDADFAGCTQTQRSTSGVHMALMGPRSRFPVAAASKIQGCVSNSTPEAELVAGHFGYRHYMAPSLDLLPKGYTGIFHEDNTAMIGVCKSGKNPSMKYISRTHGISVQALHERLCNPLTKDNINLIHTPSDEMAADIYTKHFTDPEKWSAVCKLINVLDMSSEIPLSEVVTSYTYTGTLIEANPLDDDEKWDEMELGYNPEETVQSIAMPVTKPNANSVFDESDFPLLNRYRKNDNKLFDYFSKACNVCSLLSSNGDTENCSLCCHFRCQ